MADWKEIAQDCLKDYDGAFEAMTKRFDEANIKLKNISTGDYVASKKYSDDVAKLNADIAELTNKLAAKEEEHSKALEKMDIDNNAAMQEQKVKLQSIVKSLAIEREIAGMNISDELQRAGIRAMIKVDDIQLDDDFGIVGGLEEQISNLKTQYASSFEQPKAKLVSTGHALQQGNNGGMARVYKSLAEIKALTQAEVDADLENIQSQLPNLK